VIKGAEGRKTVCKGGKEGRGMGGGSQGRRREEAKQGRTGGREARGRDGGKGKKKGKDDLSYR